MLKRKPKSQSASSSRQVVVAQTVEQVKESLQAQEGQQGNKLFWKAASSSSAQQSSSSSSSAASSSSSLSADVVRQGTQRAAIGVSKKLVELGVVQDAIQTDSGPERIEFCVQNQLGVTSDTDSLKARASELRSEINQLVQTSQKDTGLRLRGVKKLVKRIMGDPDDDGGDGSDSSDDSDEEMSDSDDSNDDPVDRPKSRDRKAAVRDIDKFFSDLPDKQDAKRLRRRTERFISQNHEAILELLYYKPRRAAEAVITRMIFKQLFPQGWYVTPNDGAKPLDDDTKLYNFIENKRIDNYKVRGNFEVNNTRVTITDRDLMKELRLAVAPGYCFNGRIAKLEKLVQNIQHESVKNRDIVDYILGQVNDTGFCEEVKAKWDELTNRTGPSPLLYGKDSPIYKLLTTKPLNGNQEAFVVPRTNNKKLLVYKIKGSQIKKEPIKKVPDSKDQEEHSSSNKPGPREWGRIITLDKSDFEKWVDTVFRVSDKGVFAIFQTSEDVIDKSAQLGYVFQQGEDEEYSHISELEQIRLEYVDAITKRTLRCKEKGKRCANDHSCSGGDNCRLVNIDIDVDSAQLCSLCFRHPDKLYLCYDKDGHHWVCDKCGKVNPDDAEHAKLREWYCMEHDAQASPVLRCSLCLDDAVSLYTCTHARGQHMVCFKCGGLAPGQASMVGPEWRCPTHSLDVNSDAWFADDATNWSPDYNGVIDLIKQSKKMKFQEEREQGTKKIVELWGHDYSLFLAYVAPEDALSLLKTLNLNTLGVSKSISSTVAVNAYTNRLLRDVEYATNLGLHTSHVSTFYEFTMVPLSRLQTLLTTLEAYLRGLGAIPGGSKAEQQSPESSVRPRVRTRPRRVIVMSDEDSDDGTAALSAQDSDDDIEYDAHVLQSFKQQEQEDHSEEEDEQEEEPGGIQTKKTPSNSCNRCSMAVVDNGVLSLSEEDSPHGGQRATYHTVCDISSDCFIMNLSVGECSGNLYRCDHCLRWACVKCIQKDYGKKPNVSDANWFCSTACKGAYTPPSDECVAAINEYSRLCGKLNVVEFAERYVKTVLNARLCELCNYSGDDMERIASVHDIPSHAVKQALLRDFEQHSRVVFHSKTALFTGVRDRLSSSMILRVVSIDKNLKVRLDGELKDTVDELVKTKDAAAFETCYHKLLAAAKKPYAEQRSNLLVMMNSQITTLDSTLQCHSITDMLYTIQILRRLLLPCDKKRLEALCDDLSEHIKRQDVDNHDKDLLRKGFDAVQERVNLMKEHMSEHKSDMCDWDKVRGAWRHHTSDIDWLQARITFLERKISMYRNRAASHGWICVDRVSMLERELAELAFAELHVQLEDAPTGFDPPRASLMNAALTPWVDATYKRVNKIFTAHGGNQIHSMYQEMLSRDAQHKMNLMHELAERAFPAGTSWNRPKQRAMTAFGSAEQYLCVYCGYPTHDKEHKKRKIVECYPQKYTDNIGKLLCIHGKSNCRRKTCPAPHKDLTLKSRGVIAGMIRKLEIQLGKVLKSMCDTQLPDGACGSPAYVATLQAQIQNSSKHDKAYNNSQKITYGKLKEGDNETFWCIEQALSDPSFVVDGYKSAVINSIAEMHQDYRQSYENESVKPTASFVSPRLLSFLEFELESQNGSVAQEYGLESNDDRHRRYLTLIAALDTLDPQALPWVREEVKQKNEGKKRDQVMLEEARDHRFALIKLMLGFESIVTPIGKNGLVPISVILMYLIQTCVYMGDVLCAADVLLWRADADRSINGSFLEFICVILESDSLCDRKYLRFTTEDGANSSNNVSESALAKHLKAYEQVAMVNKYSEHTATYLFINHLCRLASFEIEVARTNYPSQFRQNWLRVGVDRFIQELEVKEKNEPKGPLPKSRSRQKRSSFDIFSLFDPIKSQEQLDQERRDQLRDAEIKQKKSSARIVFENWKKARIHHPEAGKLYKKLISDRMKFELPLKENDSNVWLKEVSGRWVMKNPPRIVVKRPDGRLFTEVNLQRNQIPLEFLDASGKRNATYTAGGPSSSKRRASGSLDSAEVKRPKSAAGRSSLSSSSSTPDPSEDNKMVVQVKWRYYKTKAAFLKNDGKKIEPFSKDLSLQQKAELEDKVWDKLIRDKAAYPTRVSLKFHDSLSKNEKQQIKKYRMALVTAQQSKGQLLSVKDANDLSNQLHKILGEKADEKVADVLFKALYTADPERGGYTRRRDLCSQVRLGDDGEYTYIHNVKMIAREVRRQLDKQG